MSRKNNPDSRPFARNEYISDPGVFVADSDAAEKSEDWSTRQLLPSALCLEFSLTKCHAGMKPITSLGPVRVVPLHP
uniref:Uncharacterized protein n=1 Tax=uncultured bacterium BLR5 TaxID=506522 RepID=C0INX3_9BACT|nr:hypothetical protein AKSOIL_0049 [uncultured bacterium BLR5]